MEWLYSVPWLRVGWYRKVQAGGMVVFSTLVEGWMVQEEAGSPLVVHEAQGKLKPFLEVFSS